MYQLTHDTPFGLLTIVASDSGLRAILWPNDRPNRVKLPPSVGLSHPVLQETVAQLDDYVAGTRHDFDLPLDLVGTPFQLAVWNALGTIRYGTTVSYGELASDIGRPTASRAVGAAVGRNPVSIVVPCHRVVGTSGSLTGFAGGLPAKQWLLAHELASSPSA